MGTVVITDGKYRSSIAAARMLRRAGWRVVAVQSRGDCPLEPPVFTSRYVSEARWLDGSAADLDYPDRLYALLEGYGHPVLFCAGAATLNAVSGQRERFPHRLPGRAGRPERQGGGPPALPGTWHTRPPLV